MTIALNSMSGNLQSPLASLLGGSGLSGSSLEGFFASLLSGASAEGAEGFSLQDFISSIEGQGSTRAQGDFLTALLDGLGELQEDGSLSDLGDFSFVEGSAQSLLLGEGEDTDLLSLSVPELIAEIKSTLSELSHAISASPAATGIDSLDELAAAYEELGLTAEEAQEKAIRTASALDLLHVKVKEAAENPDKNTDILSAIFDSLSEAQKTGLVDFVHQNTQIRLHQIGKSLELSENLSTTDIALKMRTGAPLTAQGLAQLSTAASAEAASADDVALEGALKAGDAGANSKNEQPITGKEGDVELDKKALLALKEIADLKQSERQVPEGLNRVLRQLTGASSSDSKEPTLFKSLEGEALKAESAVRANAATVSGNISDIAKDAAVKEAISTATEVATDGDVPAQGEVSRYMAKKESGDIPSSSASAKQLFTVKAGDGGELTVEDFSTTVLTSDDAVDAGDVSAEDVLEQGLEVQNNRIDNRAKAESTTQLDRLARQADIVSQVNVKVRQLASQGGGSVKLMINPPELGEMEIRLEITNRSVKGQIIVQTQEVADQLARDLRHLQQGLADAGLSLGEEGFTFLLSQDESERLAQGEEGDSSSSTFGQRGQDDTEEGDIALSAPRSTGPWRDVNKVLDMNI